MRPFNIFKQNRSFYIYLFAAVSLIVFFIILLIVTDPQKNLFGNSLVATTPTIVPTTVLTNSNAYLNIKIPNNYTNSEIHNTIDTIKLVKQTVNSPDGSVSMDINVIPQNASSVPSTGGTSYSVPDDVF